MNTQALSAHVLYALAVAQMEGRRLDLDALVSDLQVRRGDIRRVLSALHREGYLDVLRMRLTMMGFALGRSYIGKPLPELRRPRLAAVAAA